MPFSSTASDNGDIGLAGQSCSRWDKPIGERAFILTCVRFSCFPYVFSVSSVVPSSSFWLRLRRAVYTVPSVVFSFFSFACGLASLRTVTLIQDVRPRRFESQYGHDADGIRNADGMQTGMASPRQPNNRLDARVKYRHARSE